MSVALEPPQTAPRTRTHEAAATKWFDAVSANTRAAADLTLPPRADAGERTMSTIRYNDDSAAPPSSSGAGSPLRGPDGQFLSARRLRRGDMYEDAMRAQLAKRQWAALEQMRQLMLDDARVEQECPFRPRLSSYAAKIVRPAELAPQNRIYDEMMRKKEWCLKKRQENIKLELEECTFRPLTLRAATLKSSAHVHDSQVFSELYHHHEEQNRFRNEMRPYVVEQLERHMLYKGPSTNPMPEDKIMSVVERLFSRGTVIKGDEHKKRGQSKDTTSSFRPVVSTESKRIVKKQRESGQVAEDVMERLLHPSGSYREWEKLRRQDAEKQTENELKLAHSEYNQELREILQRERRRTFIATKFDILSKAINRERQAHEGSQRFATEEHGVEDLLEAAGRILSADETRELYDILTSSGASRLNRESFVAVCENAVEGLSDPSASPLGRVPPPQLHAAYVRDIDAEMMKNEVLWKPLQRKVPSPDVLEEMKARQAERQRRHAEEIIAQRRTEEEEEWQQCTFTPRPYRKIPYKCHVNYKVEVKTTRADALRRAHIQKTLEEEERGGAADLPPLSAKSLFGTKIDDAREKHPKQHRSMSAGVKSVGDSIAVRTKPTLVTPWEATPLEKTSLTRRKKQETTRRGYSTVDAGLIRRECALDAPAAPLETRRSESAAAAPSRVYRDVVSEHAAFGRDCALTELGRELILKQLCEHRQKR